MTDASGNHRSTNYTPMPISCLLCRQNLFRKFVEMPNFKDTTTDKKCKLVILEQMQQGH